MVATASSPACGVWPSVTWATRDPRRERTRDTAVLRATHRLIAKVSHDFDHWSYNTAVAACREFTNELYKYVQAGARTATLDRGGGHTGHPDGADDART